MLNHGTTRLFSASDSKAEYKAMVRTLSGENKSSKLESKIINDCLLKHVCKKLNNTKEIYVIHDPSDIRKPHSRKTDNLGKVRALNGDIINGYSTHNMVAISPNNKAVHLLAHISYSNIDPKFLKREFIVKLDKKSPFEGDDKARELYASEDYFNKKTLSTEEIKRVSVGLKKGNEMALITHILDREFDDDEYLKLIDKEISQDYVIRAKKSRTLKIEGDDGKKVKLIAADFSNVGEKKFQKLRIGNKCIQDGKMTLSWHKFEDYSAVKIKICDRKGGALFKDEMLILTNKGITSLEQAYQIYRMYLKRSKIEYVFKFLKEGLGWEEMQIQDFKAIQNLLAICFYVASYLYEIGEEKAYDDYAILLAELGGGKGEVTRHFITKGIRHLLDHFRVARILKSKDVSQAQQNALSDTFEIVL